MIELTYRPNIGQRNVGLAVEENRADIRVLDGYLKRIDRGGQWAAIWMDWLELEGPFYGDDSPLTPELLRAIGVADVEMMGRMEERDAAGFFAHLTKTQNGRRVCGSSAIYTTLSLLPEGPRGQLKAYEQPPFPEEGNTVTICSMVWE